MVFKVAVLFMMTAMPLIDIPIPKFALLLSAEYITLGRMVQAG